MRTYSFPLSFWRSYAREQKSGFSVCNKHRRWSHSRTPQQHSRHALSAFVDGELFASLFVSILEEERLASEPVTARSLLRYDGFPVRICFQNV